MRVIDIFCQAWLFKAFDQTAKLNDQFSLTDQFYDCFVCDESRGLLVKKNLFEKQPHPECEHCDVPLTIQHILIDCNLFYNERGPILTALRENDLPIEVSSILNEYFPAEIMITFLKNINYLHKIPLQSLDMYIHLTPKSFDLASLYF